MGVLFLPSLCIRSRICSGASNTLPSWFRLWIIVKTGGGGERELVLCLVKGQVGGIEIWNRGWRGGEQEKECIARKQRQKVFFWGKHVQNLHSLLLCHTCSRGIVGPALAGPSLQHMANLPSSHSGGVGFFTRSCGSYRGRSTAPGSTGSGSFGFSSLEPSPELGILILLGMPWSRSSKGKEGVSPSKRA